MIFWMDGISLLSGGWTWRMIMMAMMMMRRLWSIIKASALERVCGKNMFASWEDGRKDEPFPCVWGAVWQKRVDIRGQKPWDQCCLVPRTPRSDTWSLGKRTEGSLKWERRTWTTKILWSDFEKIWGPCFAAFPTWFLEAGNGKRVIDR